MPPDDLPSDLLIHMNAPYDPARRHQYYEQHKHLKGRQPGQGPQAGSGRQPTSAKVIPIRPTLHSAANQAGVQARVKAIQGRLKLLRAHLEALLKQAGASSKTSTTKKTTAKKTATKKPLTSQQKQQRKVAAKKAAAKRHQTAQTNTAPTVTEQIAQVRAQIRQVEQNLRAAVAEARRLASAPQSKTATNGR